MEIEIIVEISVLGCPELKKGYLQNVCLYVYRQHWRENTGFISNNFETYIPTKLI